MIDEHGLLDGIGNWSNYWPLLLLALEETSGPVLELGMGPGSTEKLHRYCAARDRLLVSLDSDASWAAGFSHLATPRHQIRVVTDWRETGIEREDWGAVLVDHAPGERRHEDIRLLRDRAQVIVIHDSEPESTGYLLDRIWPLFPYRVETRSDGAWTAAVSNTIDLRRWVDLAPGGYRIWSQ